MNFQIQDSAYGGEGYKPFPMVRLIVRFPAAVLAAVLVLFIVIAGVGLSGYVDVDRRITSFRVNGVVTDQQDAYSMATVNSASLRDPTFDSASNITPAVAHDPNLTYRYTSMASLQFIYQSKSGNVLTAESLADIRAIENKFIASLGYSDRCLLEFKNYRTLPQGLYPIPTSDQKVQCTRPRTALNMFYPTLNASETRHYALYDLYDLDGNGTSLYSIPEITNMMAFDGSSTWFVSRNFTIWNQTSTVLRSQFTFGAPVAPHTSLSDLATQKEEFASWIIPFSSQFAKWSTSNVRLLWQGTAITDWEVTQLIKRDSLFCIGSVFLVLFWMVFHFRSVVLALMGMLNILLSIPVGHFVTHIIMGNKYLGLLMTLPIFIILGIGCDDVFVFFDAWRASGTQGAQIANQVETRLDWTYRRAASSMLVTSLTSSATFFIAATSPIMPIRLFGIAVGSTILANLVLVTTFFPAALLLWHHYLEHRFAWGNSISALSEMWWKPSEEIEQQRPVPAEEHNPTSIYVSMSDVKIIQDVKDGEDLPPQPLPELELDTHPYLSKRKKKTTTIEPDAPVPLENGDESTEEDGEDKAVRVVSKTATGVKMVIELDEEPLADPWKLNAAGRYFYFSYVPFVYGLRWIVMLVALVLLVFCFVAAFYLAPHRGNPNFFPVGSNLNDFDDLTENVFNLDDSSYGEVNLVWGIAGIDRSHIDLYDPTAIGTTTYDPSFNLSDANVQQFLVDVFEKAKLARIGAEDSEFIANRNMQLHKSFITAFKNYRLARNEAFPVMDSNEFWTSLKAWLLSDDGAPHRSKLGWTTESTPQAQTLLWCAITLRSSIVPATASSSNLFSYQQSWSNFMSSQKAIAPEAAKNGFATSTDFVWVLNMKALIRQAGWGTFGASIVAFVVLLLVTWNLLISLYATIAIGMVVMLVVGFMSAAGWDLGVMEFVSLTIVVGVSIGYTVHLGMAYLTYARHAMLKDKPRVAIVQYAMAEMGSPLISGAVTTATSVIMLFFCKITLFSHFGKFLFVNIIVALSTSFFLFVVLLILLGPRGDFGSIHAIISWNKERQRKKREKKRLQEHLAAAKSIDHLKENRNATNDDPNTHFEMTPMKSPSRNLDRSVHGLSLNDSTASLGNNTPLRSSASMSDFELRFDDDAHSVPEFDLDAATSSPARRIDMPDDDDDDEPAKLTPVKTSGLPKPSYEDGDEEDDDSEPPVHIQLQ